VTAACCRASCRPPMWSGTWLLRDRLPPSSPPSPSSSGAATRPASAWARRSPCPPSTARSWTTARSRCQPWPAASQAGSIAPTDPGAGPVDWRHIDARKGNVVSDWTAGDLDTISAAEELQIAALRPDGSLRPYVTIWVVRVGDGLYVRSYRGRDGAWFRSVLARPEGRIRAGGLTRDVTVEEPPDPAPPPPHPAS